MDKTTFETLDRVARLLEEMVEAFARQPDATRERRLYSRVEAARYLNQSPRQVDLIRGRGELPAVVIGTRVTFDRADLDALIERLKEKPSNDSRTERGVV